MTKIYKKLWVNINKKRKIQSFFLLILMILSAIAELFTISAVVPFVTVLTSPETILNIRIVELFFNYFDITSTIDIRNIITAIFISIILVAALLRFTLLYMQTRLSFEIGADFAREMYHRTLNQPFLVHVGRNSSEIVGTIVLKANALSTGALLPILTIISSFFILIFILIAIILVNPMISLLVLSILTTSYFLIGLSTKKRLDIDSGEINSKVDGLMKSLTEGLGGIRDVILENLQDSYTQDFEKSHHSFRRSAGNIHIIASAPKFLIEAVGMVIIIVIALSMLNSEESVSALPILAVFALGAQKLFPILQNIFASTASLRGNTDTLLSIFSLMDQKLTLDQGSIKNLNFKKSITLKDVKFEYNKDSIVLNKIDIEFKKGDRIGIIGETGSGKSTIVDILMALIFPTEGSLLVDGEKINIDNCNSWHQKISHVPQSIYLIDASIAENIAFGVPKEQIDYKRVMEAAEKAQISDTVNSFEFGYGSRVGERGLKLSGGQLQRIGLARAFYKQKDVLILDEATSALDLSTEQKVMNAIDNSKDELTIFIVAHRIETLKACSKIIKIENGKISYNGSYENIPR